MESKRRRREEKRKEGGNHTLWVLLGDRGWGRGEGRGRGQRLFRQLGTVCYSTRRPKYSTMTGEVYLAMILTPLANPKPQPRNLLPRPPRQSTHSAAQRGGFGVFVIARVFASFGVASLASTEVKSVGAKTLRFRHNEHPATIKWQLFRICGSKDGAREF